MEKTVTAFTTQFEAEFGDILLNPPRTKPARYTEFFLIHSDKKRAANSDYDTECWVEPDALTVENVRRFDGFMRSFTGLTSVGHLLTFTEDYASQWHHVHNMPCLHYMGYMPEAQTAPFFDIHIFLDPSEDTNREVIGVLKEAFQGKTDEEYKAWIMLTAWRKLKNNDVGLAKFMADHMAVIFPDDYQSFTKDPQAFFEQHSDSGKYQTVVARLAIESTK